MPRRMMCKAPCGLWHACCLSGAVKATAGRRQMWQQRGPWTAWRHCTPQRDEWPLRSEIRPPACAPTLTSCSKELHCLTGISLLICMPPAGLHATWALCSTSCAKQETPEAGVCKSRVVLVLCVCIETLHCAAGKPRARPPWRQGVC